MLGAILLLLAQSAPATNAVNPGNLGKELYWASTAASGSRLCNRGQAADYARQFEQRYGGRIRALLNYHELLFGPDPEFVFTTSCQVWRGSRRQQDRDHKRAMDRFEAALRDLEREYGPRTAR